MSCDCQKSTGSVGSLLRQAMWWGVVISALMASPDVRKLLVASATQASASLLRGVVVWQQRSVTQAEQEARKVGDRIAALEAARGQVADQSERVAIERELEDSSAEATSAKVALGDGIRGLEAVRAAADSVANSVAQARGYTPQDRLAQAAKLREAREGQLAAAKREREVREAAARFEEEASQAARRAEAIEAEAKRSAAAEREAKRVLTTTQREKDDARREAEAARRASLAARREIDKLRAQLADRRDEAPVRVVKSPEEPAACSHEAATGGSAEAATPRRVVKSSYRVRTQAGGK
jgi:hypothetical protein